MPQSPLLKINDNLVINIFQLESLKFESGPAGQNLSEKLSIFFPSGLQPTTLYGLEAQRAFDFITQHCEVLPPVPPPAAETPADTAASRFAGLVDQNPTNEQP